MSKKVDEIRAEFEMNQPVLVLYADLERNMISCSIYFKGSEEFYRDDLSIEEAAELAKSGDCTFLRVTDINGEGACADLPNFLKVLSEIDREIIGYRLDALEEQSQGMKKK